MSSSDGAGSEGADSDSAGGENAPFVYTGQSPFEIPRDVTHVLVDPSVKVIGDMAFFGCKQLVEVELCEGLERIEASAFSGCSSLKDAKIPSTVKVIGNRAFEDCEQLLEAELCEGLVRIEARAFSGCSSLNHVKIPSTGKMIGDMAFFECNQLVEVVLCEGLEQVERGAFDGCSSLKYVKIPSTVKVIGNRAFYGCVQLVEVVLFKGLERIGAYAFQFCSSLKHVKIPSTVKDIGSHAFQHCKQLMEVVLCEGLERIEEGAFHNCHSLRNLLIPSTSTHVASKCFMGCHDLLRLFGSQENIESALKSRFGGLPIHEFCYYQSHHPTEVGLEHLNDLFGKKPNHKRPKLDASNKTIDYNQDCLGMTPLHILACSEKHNLDIYQIIISDQPGSLITGDKWGCLPLIYAIWGNAPQKIVQFLIDAQKSAFPDFILNWDKMLTTMCRAGVSLNIVMGLLQIQRASFPRQNFNLPKAARELTIQCLATCESFEDFPSVWESLMEALGSSQAHQELVQSLLEVEQRLFPDQTNADWQMVCEEFVQPLSGWWHTQDTGVTLETFNFLVNCNIPERLGMIGMRKWRMDIQNLVKGLSSVIWHDTSNLFDTIHSKLVTYEREYPRLKDASCLLELALWKFKLDEMVMKHQNNVGVGNHGQAMKDDADRKRECLMNCGAGIIIPNVLPFLIPAISSDDDTEESTSDDEGGSGGDDALDGFDNDSSSSADEISESSS